MAVFAQSRDVLDSPMRLYAYAYASGNPTTRVDRSGDFWDVVIDAGSVGYDLYRIAKDNVFGNEPNLNENLTALAADVAGAAHPGVVGLGAGVRAAKAGEHVGGAAARMGAQGAGDAAKRIAKTTGTETVQRAMSRAELDATRSTGLVRGGRGGVHYASDAVNSSATRAQDRLALPVRPDVRVTMEVPIGHFSAPTPVRPYEVAPGQTLSGGGMERTATGKIPAKILKVDEL